MKIRDYLLKSFILLTLLAYIFSISVRTIWVYQFQDVDGLGGMGHFLFYHQMMGMDMPRGERYPNRDPPKGASPILLPPLLKVSILGGNLSTLFLGPYIIGPRVFRALICGPIYGGRNLNIGRGDGPSGPRAHQHKKGGIDTF